MNVFVFLLSLYIYIYINIFCILVSSWKHFGYIDLQVDSVGVLMQKGNVECSVYFPYFLKKIAKFPEVVWNIVKCKDDLHYLGELCNIS